MKKPNDAQSTQTKSREVFVASVSDLLFRKVIDGLDLGDKDQLSAAKKLWAKRQQATGTPTNDEVFCEISSDAAKQALVACLQAWVVDDALELKKKRAEELLDIRKKQVLLAILETEDVDPAEDVSIDTFRYLVCKNKDRQEALQKIFGLASALCKGTASVSLDDVRKGKFPDEVAEDIEEPGGASDFLKDLAEFLAESGPEGQQLAKEVLSVADTAQRVANSDKAPKPLRFLAKMASDLVHKN